MASVQKLYRENYAKINILKTNMIFVTRKSKISILITFWVNC
jgi:hypothetical protein